MDYSASVVLEENWRCDLKVTAWSMRKVTRRHAVKKAKVFSLEKYLRELYANLGYLDRKLWLSSDLGKIHLTNKVRLREQ